MNSTINPQHADQEKSTADVVPDIEQPSPQLQGVTGSCSVTASTATADAMLLNHSNSIDVNASSHSLQLSCDKSLEIVHQLGNVTSFSTNHGSTHNDYKPDDSVTMPSAIMDMDVLEKVDTDAASGLHGSFLMNGEYHAYRRYRNSGFCSRQSQRRQQESDIGDTTIEANAHKSDNDGHVEVDNGRRRSGRKRKGSKVTELEFLQSKRSCAVVEVPDDVMPGDSLLVAWPKAVDELDQDGSPQFFLCQVPETFPAPKKKKIRLLKVMAPWSQECPKKRRSRVDKCKQGTPYKSSDRPPLQSPQEAQWSFYRKSTSRVGELYQVPNLPRAGVVKTNDSAEITVPGYEA